MTNEWVSVKDKLPTSNCILLVKTSTGKITKAYFYLDQIDWVAFYGQKTSYFWDKETKKPMFDVIEWKYQEKEKE